VRHIRTAVLTSLAIAALAAIWHAKTTAQEKPTVGVVTLFSQEKLDVSFTKALASGGSDLLWSHSAGNAAYNVSTHSRESVKSACKPEGCSHKDYTAVVYVVSGSANLVVGGSAKSASAAQSAGQAIQGGESHRIAKGDLFIVPPDTIHWYKNVEAPFRYIEIPVP